MESVTGEIIGIVVCSILSGLFSGSETALTSLHAARLDRLIALGKSGTRLLERWRDQPSELLSFLLVSNNLVNILASSIGTELALQLTREAGLEDPESVAIALAVGVMTFIILVFGEVIPKTYARHNPQRILPVLPVLLFFYYLTWPFARALGAVGKLFIRITGGDPALAQPQVTEEELEYMIRRGTKEGSLDVAEEKMLSGVLTLKDTLAKEVMVPRTEVVMLESKDSLSAVMHAIDEHMYSRYPVYQGSQDKIIGFFYARDLLAFFRQKDRSRPFRLRDFVRAPYFVPETKKLDDLLREFQKERIHMAIVVDEYGGTSGLVTLEDVLEEMIGEIYDEYDEQENLVTRVDEQTFIVDSRLMLDDIEEELGVKVTFPEDREFETVGGLLMELAGRVPQKGQTFTYQSPDSSQPKLRLSVLVANNVKVGRIRLHVETEEASSEG